MVARRAVAKDAGMSVARRILVVGLALAGGLAVGCLGSKQARRDVYVHLMTPLQEANYRLLEAGRKPVSLRLAYLQEIGVYQTWSEQPKDIQDAVLQRKVLEGMSPVQVQMAWGPPEQRTETTDAADRAAGHSKVVWDYDYRSGGTGGAYVRSVCFFDDEVLWVRDAR